MNRAPWMRFFTSSAALARAGVGVRLLVGVLTVVTLLSSAVGGSAAAAQSGGTATATFTVGACPEGVDVSDVGENPGSAGPLCGGDLSFESQPIAGVPIVLHAPDEGYVFTAKTDEDGTAEFTQLPAGSYTASFDRDRPAATRCTTTVADSEEREIANIAAVEIPLADGQDLSCVVALSGSEEGAQDAPNGELIDEGTAPDDADADAADSGDEEPSSSDGNGNSGGGAPGGAAPSTDESADADGENGADGGNGAGSEDSDLFPQIDVPIFGGADDADTGGDADTDQADDADDGVTLSLTAYVCTPGDDAVMRERMAVAGDPDGFFDEDLDVSELQEVCAPPSEPMTFTLTNANSDDSEEVTLGGDEDATHVWTELPGEGTNFALATDHAETDGDPIIRCVDESDGEGISTSFYYATDGEASISVSDENNSDCYWFRVDLTAPAASTSGGTTGDADAETDTDSVDDTDTDTDATTDLASTDPNAPGNSAVVLLSYTCDASTDPELAERIAFQNENWIEVDSERGITIEELRDTCPLSPDPIAYTVTDGDTDATDTRAVGGSDAAEPTVWAANASFGVTLTATVPETFGTPVVFCDFIDEGQTESVFGTSPAPITDGALNVSLNSGTDYSCEWFNVDLTGDGPGEADVDASTNTTTTESADGTESNDAAGASDSAIAIQSFTCDVSDDADLAERIDYQIDEWISAEPELGVDLEELHEACAPTEEPIAFTLTNTGTGETDSRQVGGPTNDEAAVWETTPGTSYTLQADEPDGAGDPIVFCESISPGETESTFGLSQSPVSQGEYNIMVGSGTQSCEWFHIVGGVPAPTTGTLTIVSYTCDVSDDDELAERIAFQSENWTEIDPEQGIDLDELHEVCAPSPDPIAFAVTDTKTGTTDERDLGGPNGDEPQSWEIAPGVSYTVDADEPDGFGEPLVICTTFDTGRPEPDADASPTPISDGVLFLGLGVGITDSCEWFNVDLAGDGASGAPTSAGATRAEVVGA